MLEKVRPQNRCTRLTDAEVSDLKAATGMATIEAALQEAAEYRIMHPIPHHAPKKDKGGLNGR